MPSGQCLVEYSASPEADPFDEDGWGRYMPALGRTVEAESLRQDLDGMGPMRMFSRAYMNRRPKLEGEGWAVISKEVWEAGEMGRNRWVARSRTRPLEWRSAPTDPVLGAALAGWAGGAPPSSSCWTRSRAPTRCRRSSGWTAQHPVSLVAVDPRSNAATLLEGLKQTGLRLLCPDASGMAVAWGRFHDQTLAGRLRHRGHPT